MKYRGSFLFLMLVLSSNAQASRTIFVPPIEFKSVHGGVVDLGGGVKDGCVTAGMYNYANAAIDPVHTAIQFYFIHFKNLSDLQQKVTLTIRNGSMVLTHFGNHVPGISVANCFGRAVPEISSPQFTLPPNGDLDYVIRFQVGKTSSGMTPNDARCDLFGMPIGAVPLKMYYSSVSGATAPPASYDLSGAGCFSMELKLMLRITVEEDRGAILASISGAAHRGNGTTDHYFTGVPSIQVNGGRPF